jgi:hypothetical protein
MHHPQECLLASGCSPRRRQRSVAEGSLTGKPIGPKGYGAASRLVSRPRKRVAVGRLLPATATSRFHLRVAAAWPRFLRCPSSAMDGHRLCRGASNPETWRTQGTTLGSQPEALGRKPHWARHLAALATRPCEYCGLELGALRRSGRRGVVAEVRPVTLYTAPDARSAT